MPRPICNRFQPRKARRGRIHDGVFKESARVVIKVSNSPRSLRRTREGRPQRRPRADSPHGDFHAQSYASIADGFCHRRHPARHRERPCHRHHRRRLHVRASRSSPNGRRPIAEKTGSQVNYAVDGSGGGIAQIKAATIDFGASDKPLSPDELSAAGLGQFPIVIGGVVPVVNVEGIKAGDLKLTGAAARRHLSSATSELERPKHRRPQCRRQAAGNSRSRSCHRSDGSGTTFNFTNYLSKVSGECKTKVGEGTSVQWPTGVGGKGNEGVAAYVQQINGLDRLRRIRLRTAEQDGLHAGAERTPASASRRNLTSFAAAASHADWKNAKDFQLVITNAPGDDSWPITATTFAIIYKTPKDAAHSKEVLNFFKWSFDSGSKEAEGLDYVAAAACARAADRGLLEVRGQALIVAVAH